MRVTAGAGGSSSPASATRRAVWTWVWAVAVIRSSAVPVEAAQLEQAAGLRARTAASAAAKRRIIARAWAPMPRTPVRPTAVEAAYPVDGNSTIEHHQ